MNRNEIEELRGEVDRLKASMRTIAHDLSNPLGVLRMAAYYLQTAHPDNQKRDHYYNIIHDSVTRVEDGLKRLRTLCDIPPQDVRGPKGEDSQS